jgi:malic enzyme
VSRLPVVSYAVAVAVARQAIREGVAERAVDDVDRHIAQAIWEPDYPEYEPAV